MVEHRSSQSISIGYFVVLLVGFLLWIVYGIAASNLALIVPNMVAAMVISATILVGSLRRAWPDEGWTEAGPRRGLAPPTRARSARTAPWTASADSVLAARRVVRGRGGRRSRRQGRHRA